jgi:hypothetical protein
MAEFSRPPGTAIAICAVPQYRAYIIGPDGHFKDAVHLDCANDAAAIASAEQLINDHGIEVWQEDRMVTRLATAIRAANEADSTRT